MAIPKAYLATHLSRSYNAIPFLDRLAAENVAQSLNLFFLDDLFYLEGPREAILSFQIY